MKCIKCQTININNANYCKKCQYHFSHEEQEAAKSITLIGKIEQLERKINIINLNAMTGSIIFKIITLLIIIIPGIYLFLNYGNDIKLLEDDNYRLEYNTKMEEYYVFTTNNEINLNVYVPKSNSDIIVKKVNSNGEEVIAKNYSKNMALEITNDNYYYVLSSKNKEMKIRVYRVDSYE